MKKITILIVLLVGIIANAQVGVGTTTPAYTFHTVNTGNIGATALGAFENDGVEGVSLSGYNLSNTNGYNAIEGITDYSGTAFTPAGVFGLAIYQGPSQSPGIGVRGASNEWQGTGVFGSRFNSGGPNLGFGGLFLNDLGYTGGLQNMSDIKTKKDIFKITNALNIIENLNPVSYYFDLDKYPNLGLNTEKEFGFIAQEVREILPEITRLKSFDINACSELGPNQQVKSKRETFVTMDYTRIIPILTKGMQEQQDIIDAQNSKIDVLESKLMVLEAKMNELLQNQE